jgi:hypothetical protein
MCNKLPIVGIKRYGRFINKVLDDCAHELLTGGVHSIECGQRSMAVNYLSSNKGSV